MKFDWRASVKDSNRVILTNLQNRMVDYYSKNTRYYEEIDYNWNTWLNKKDLCQQDILDEIKAASSVIEIGCGKANILKCHPQLQAKYTGVDFSDQLVLINRVKYPRASFHQMSSLPKQKFDVVFSHFVLEHVVFPDAFLQQCTNLLNENGKLIILCPDFIGRGGITSQTIGFSQGNGRSKLRSRKYFDALVTLLDSRLIMRILCLFWLVKSLVKPQFAINLNPTCFTYNFTPDVDAVYLTNKTEIQTFLKNQISWTRIPENIRAYCKTKRLIYLKGRLKG
jgi:2-polyprenyl-3-methyl-5-hydroxy-6-metoxy-1,4-benzoquinol methylase